MAKGQWYTRTCGYCGEPFRTQSCGAKYCPPPSDCRRNARSAQQADYYIARQPMPDYSDLSSAQIEQRIKDAYAQIQRDRQEGRRLSAADIAWTRTHDPVQAANSGAADVTKTKHAAQSYSPKAPRVGRAA